jgi:hypothetical protein
MKIRSLGIAADMEVIAVDCDCGQSVYALVNRWQVPMLQEKDDIIRILRETSRQAMLSSGQPRIHQNTRDCFKSRAEALKNLANKLEKGEIE